MATFKHLHEAEAGGVQDHGVEPDLPFHGLLRLLARQLARRWFAERNASSQKAQSQPLGGSGEAELVAPSISAVRREPN